MNKNQFYQQIEHTFAPVFDSTSIVLVLGTFPSVKSRENQFYYGHPQNRFWRMLAQIYEAEVPQTIEEKKMLLLKNHIAVWDVIHSCDIEGSSDSSIKNVIPNDMNVILQQAKIHTIILNGGKAYELFQKYCQCEDMPPVVKLPSTSPANAACKLERLVAEWGAVLNG